MTRRWPAGEGSTPLLVAAALGMGVTFLAGWAVADSRNQGTGTYVEASAGQTLPAETSTPSTPGGTPSTPDPTAIPSAGPVVDPSDVGLPSISLATQAPIPKFRCPAATVRVSGAAQLSAALAGARRGSVIQLADGLYRGNFVISRSGTATKPIYLCGGRGAVLDGGSSSRGYAVHLNRVSHWRLSGFTVQNAQKGVMLDQVSGVGLQGLVVQRIGDEAVHLRRNSTGNVVRGLTIRQTGLRKPKYGEGVYIGTAESNWCEISKCRPDASDGNFVLGNAIAGTTAEAVDVKEGTSGGVVFANTFDGTGMAGGDSWVDVKGNGWLIMNNRGSAAPNDGYQVHEILDGWGERNLFAANESTVDGPGYAIRVTKTRTGNVVLCDNTQAGAEQGLTNITCR